MALRVSDLFVKVIKQLLAATVEDPGAVMKLVVERLNKSERPNKSEPAQTSDHKRVLTSVVGSLQKMLRPTGVDAKVRATVHAITSSIPAHVH